MRPCLWCCRVSRAAALVETVRFPQRCSYPSSIVVKVIEIVFVLRVQTTITLDVFIVSCWSMMVVGGRKRDHARSRGSSACAVPTQLGAVSAVEYNPFFIHNNSDDYSGRQSEDRLPEYQSNRAFV